MPRKAIDSRIPTLIRNNVQEKKRSFFVVVGDRAKDVIVHLHYILSSVDLRQNKSVLWAYKKDLLGFTSHRKKRENKIRKEIKRGIREPNNEDPFELFLTLHNIRYTYYKETDKILGNTYGMCILQDFEAITPNLLARTIETVEGGGMVLLLLKGMKSLKQLYTLTMDVHSRYRTEAYDDVVARFNERFVLSLGSCDSCLFVDDELNVLPISGGKNVKALPPPVDAGEKSKSAGQVELESVKERLRETPIVGTLVKLAKTIDQAKALMTSVDAIAEKTLRSTVALTAARGRGKSAALGIAIAAAIAHGYSNIFITSPSPENLKTLFEFVFKGFDALEYLDHTDYSIIQSTNPNFNKAIVRVNVHRRHRQTIQYIQPQDAYTLGQAELVVIDEAAAIPLPLVRKLMGPYLVFMASTINGYEGTGRSLSLKLIQQMREQSRSLTQDRPEARITSRDGDEGSGSMTISSSSRSLREITLDEPIRYAPGDAVELWLNKLLCLDATLSPAKYNPQGCPHPSKCELLLVNRDTLFSYHPVSEKFLQQMISLYVASHYKNSPNDLQLMSDAPAHQLFVLVPPVDQSASRLPEPLCVIQVALEGKISKTSVENNLNRGQRAGGDLIPWLVSQQFQDAEFAALSGARIVRIATNPEYVNQGYGSKALELLIDYFDGKFTNLSESDAFADQSMIRVTDAELAQTSLQSDDVKVREIADMPPLFARLSERKPQHLDYLGVSYGLTQPLHKFWKRAAFAPVYLRQTANELTGEYTCVMIRAFQSDANDNDTSWLGAFARDFHHRFLNLLSFEFRQFPSILALSIMESAQIGAKQDSSYSSRALEKSELDQTFSPFDLKRLDSYANNMLDYHVIIDMIPGIAEMYFLDRLKPLLSLTGVQASILLAVGLQRKSLEDIEKELHLPHNQILAMFVKTIRKVATHFRRILEGAIAEDSTNKTNSATKSEGLVDLNEPQIVTKDRNYAPIATPLQDELKSSGDQATKELKEKQRALIDALPLDRYEIDVGAAGWTEAEQQVQRATRRSNGINGSNEKEKSTGVSAVDEKEAQIPAGVTVSVRSANKSDEKKRKKVETAESIYNAEIGDKEAKKLKKGMRKASRK